MHGHASRCSSADAKALACSMTQSRSNHQLAEWLYKKCRRDAPQVAPAPRKPNSLSPAWLLNTSAILAHSTETPIKLMTDSHT